MMTFVQATYVLATFVHISNVSSVNVNDQILTKLSGPNFLGALIFLDKYFLDKTSFDNGFKFS